MSRPIAKRNPDFRTVFLCEGGYNAHSRCISVEACGLRGKAGRNCELAWGFGERRVQSRPDVTLRTDKKSEGTIAQLS